MNLIEVDGSPSLRISTVPFCKQKLSNGDHCKNCLSFLYSLPLKDISICPYGMNAIKNGKFIVCGFLIAGCFSPKKINGHKKHSPKDVFPMLTSSKVADVSEIIAVETFCEISSETTHDIAHFIGELKSLIDECNRSSYRDEEIHAIISSYHKYIDAWDIYEKKPKLLKDDGWVADTQLIHDKLNSLVSTKKKYVTFLDSIESTENNLFPIVEHAINTKGDYFRDHKLFSFVSLLAMDSLFRYRITYYKKIMAEFFNDDSFKSEKAYKHNCHKILKKLANTLSYSARMNGNYFTFIGRSKNEILASEDIYLAIYIVLENSLKYSLQDQPVFISFEDVGEDGCILKVNNSSRPISRESMDHLKEKGFIGENANKGNSHGLGLHIVQQIMDKSHFSVAYRYDNTKNEFEAEMRFLPANDCSH